MYSRPGGRGNHRKPTGKNRDSLKKGYIRRSNKILGVGVGARPVVEPSPVHIENVGLSKGITASKSQNAERSANLDLLLKTALLSEAVIRSMVSMTGFI
jgi:hypothetical protein